MLLQRLSHVVSDMPGRKFQRIHANVKAHADRLPWGGRDEEWVHRLRQRENEDVDAEERN